MKTITLTENQSKFARILIAANGLPLDKFIKVQEYECSTIGATSELRIMTKIADELGMKSIDITFSKYSKFLTEVWLEAKKHHVIQEIPKTIGAYPGDNGCTNGMGY